MKEVHPAADRITAYAMLHSEEPERARLKRHLASCSSCQALLSMLPHEAIDPLALTEVPGRETTSCETAAPEPGLANTISYHPGFGKDPQPRNEALIASCWPTAALMAHPRYRILSFLGAGGMGLVYKAEHRLMERLVALKVILPKLVNRPGMVERFHREVRAAGRLSHPNIVSAFDAEQAGDIHFLVMEFVEGADLEKVALSIGQFSCSLACSYARQIGLGLQHAFERGMVHRDIKPHNIMITPEGQAKILDFGLARLVSETHAPRDRAPAPFASPGTGLTPAPSKDETGFGWVMGTIDYVAPEEALDARLADIRADLYSLGCVIYRLLAGQVPFPDGSVEDKIRAHLEREPVPLSTLRPDLPPKLIELVQRLMAKDAAQRYQTPREAVDALECVHC